MQNKSIQELKAIAWDLNIEIMQRQKNLEAIAQLINQKQQEPKQEPKKEGSKK